MLSFTKLAVVATLIAVAFAKPWPHRNISVSAYSDPLCGTWANNFTIEEGKCLPQQTGASGKLFCMKMHKGRCVKLDVWNTSATCSGAETLKSALRCGACERSDNGKFIRTECGNPNATKWDTFYNCADNTCRPESCNKTTIEPSKCHGGLLHPNAGFIASASYDCPDVLAWVTFTDNNCTRADKNGAAVFPANACLAGYKYWCPQ